MEEIWTILKVLQWTTDYFSRHKVEQPRASAEVLLAYVLGKERIQLYLHYDQPLTATELARYRRAIQRRAAHEPTQYITQKQEFWSLEFEVNPSVLIPRPETELLVEMAIDLLGHHAHTVLDLGTGSGAIAVAIAHERPAARILAADISYAALQVAKRNALRHHVQHRIWFVAANWFDSLAPLRAGFDLIVSNPPYIGDDELAGLAPEIEKYEPATALKGGGPQGLDTIRTLLETAPDYLRPGGSILLEIGQGQADILQDELQQNLNFQGYRIKNDYSGIPRILHLTRARG